ncbi:MAG: tRNA uridine-5-carboxymethylaminomethyl(34) synthesis GTPase MnmE [Gemmobacter sp.]
MDTIFALSSAQGKAGIAVVRLSGPKASEVAQDLVGSMPAPRRASLRRVMAGEELLDEAVVLWFPAGASFTGEEVVEFHLHGSRAVVARMLAALAQRRGLRPAEPGEFTRRALENGRLDLTQVEGLSDLIDAETEAQRRQALRELSGAVGQRAAGWRSDLIRIEALVAAVIDFADEDLPNEVIAGARPLIEGLLAAWRLEVAGTGAAERIRDGFEVAIVGAPNAGKSTLLNALAGREAAITSEVAGTTRDVIEVQMDLDGLAVTFLDTAGLRDSEDGVERLGIARARARAEAADVRVFLLDDTGLPDGLAPREGDIVLLGKSDMRNGDRVGISGRTGFGVRGLLEEIAQRMQERVAGIGTLTRLRHRRAIEEAIRALESARDLLDTGDAAPELLGEDLRRARHALEMLVGRIGVEDVLGEVFARFCIGK